MASDQAAGQQQSVRFAGKPPRRQLAGGPAVLLGLIAVLLNAGFGWLGYWPVLGARVVVGAFLNLFGDDRIDIGAYPGVFALVVLVLMAWGLYLPLMVTINRIIVRLLPIPVKLTWAVAIVIMLTVGILTGNAYYGLLLD